MPTGFDLLSDWGEGFRVRRGNLLAQAFGGVAALCVATSTYPRITDVQPPDHYAMVCGVAGVCASWLLLVKLRPVSFLRTFALGSGPAAWKLLLFWGSIALATGAVAVVGVLEAWEPSGRRYAIILIAMMLLFPALSWLIEGVQDLSALGAATRLDPLSREDEHTGDVLGTIVHLSDLHLTGGRPTLERGDSPDPVFTALLEQAYEEAGAGGILLVSGDITDRGDPQEWRSFYDHLGTPERRDRVAIVPGNHDLSVPGSGWLDTASSEQAAALCLRYLWACSEIQGRRTQVIRAGGETRTFDDVLDAHRQLIERATSRLTSGDGLTQHRDTIVIGGAGSNAATMSLASQLSVAFSDFFPQLVSFPGCDLKVVVFNSNPEATNILHNAFGEVSASQLGRYEAFAAASSNAVSYVLSMHHHVGLPSLPAGTPLLGRLQDRALVLKGGPAVVRSLLSCARGTILFNGHRHVRYLGSLDCLRVVSAPSSTMGGVELGKPNSRLGPGFGVYGISQGPQGLSLSSKRWVEHDREFALNGSPQGAN